MPNVILDRRPVTNSVLAMLTAATAKKVFDNRIPAGDPLPMIDHPSDATVKVRDVYAVLYSIPGGAIDDPDWSSFDDPNSDVAFVYQVTSVGKTREEAEWMASKVRSGFLKRIAKTADNDGYANPMNVTAGWCVVGRFMDGPPGGVESQGDEGNLTFSVAERFTVHVAPSP